MSDARVNGIRGIELAVRDLAASVEFYVKAWGLEEVSRNAQTAYLRATGREHHVLALHEEGKIALLGASFAAPDKAALDALHARALASGAEVRRQPGRSSCPRSRAAATALASARPTASGRP